MSDSDPLFDDAKPASDTDVTVTETLVVDGTTVLGADPFAPISADAADQTDGEPTVVDGRWLNENTNTDSSG